MSYRKFFGACIFKFGKERIHVGSLQRYPDFCDCMEDITSKEDIVKLVDSFYKYAAADKEIGYYFNNVDWDHHKPRMHAFWEYILLDKPAKIHSIFDTHHKLKIKPRHFEIWLSYFNTTLDQNFKGPKANLAKQRAMVIAHTFNSKMNPGEELNLDFSS